MNSEELEQSLRTEFESYLKNTLAEIKQEVAEFQQKIESEFEKQKSQLNEAVQEFAEKFGDEKELEESFRDSVTEHLKLAREEGSKVTAAAFAEAEKLSEKEAEEASEAIIEFGDIRDAINEISSKDSQSEILKSLVHHATQFTPRGAFFIVKNEHLVGWRMFGTEDHPNPHIVREVFFPVSSKTALSESIETLATVAGSNDSNEDKLLYLSKLDLDEPENMYAIPLVARGRGVAVLYADNGTEGGNVNVEVLETLMRVAGLTVEVLASTQIAKTQANEKNAYAYAQEQEDLQGEDYSEQSDSNELKTSEEPVGKFEQADFSTDFDSTEDVQTEDSEAEDFTEESSGFDFQPVEESTDTTTDDLAFQVSESEIEEIDEPVSYEDNAWKQPSEEPVEDFSGTESVEDDFANSLEEDDYSVSFDSADSADSMSFESSVDDSVPISDEFQGNAEFQAPQFGDFSDPVADDSAEVAKSVETETDSRYEFETSDVSAFDTISNDSDFGVVSDERVETEDYQQEVETSEPEVVKEAVSAPPVRTRFGDRNVDLPIEVAEDERRLHNDARRFARLLVSEIKLYNEQKVKEGRESSDLYERLREAIDRSREMYDKRVQPPVAAKFDYFNYELVNTLAEGEETRLGNSYPGATTV